MGYKVRVDIDRVLELNEQCSEINGLPFERIIWTKDGNVVEIDRTCYHNWMFSGLSNMAFILSGAYLQPHYRINHFE